jgi:peptidoglycan/LPS O-acetylase OafA/YrhL
MGETRSLWSMAAETRLVGLDGIRGLAALYVVLSHVFLRSFPGYPAATGPWWTSWMIYGHFAVVVFIVLSGFSLAVSPARHDWQLNGVSRFLHRRAWRILPPYWAALVFSLLVAWLIIPQPGLPEPNAMSVIANGLLLQDVIDAPTPNRAFWTIAVEAQLYLVFPLLLLFIRRVNAVTMLATVTVVVVAAGALASYSPVAHWLMRLTPQFAALFALGMVAAGIMGGAPGSAERVRASKRRRDWPWHWLALAAAAPVLATIVWKGSVWTIGHNLFWIDLAFGPAIGCLFAALATGRPTSFVWLLNTRPMRTLGSMSYSLYLVHLPIVTVICEVFLADQIRTGIPSFLLSLAIAVPATLIFSRLFAAVFEIPFVRHRGWAPLRAAVNQRLSGTVRQPATSDSPRAQPDRIGATAAVAAASPGVAGDG